MSNAPAFCFYLTVCLCIGVSACVHGCVSVLGPPNEFTQQTFMHMHQHVTRPMVNNQILVQNLPNVAACGSDVLPRQRERVVKVMDSKSIGLCPQVLESPRCRCLFPG